MLRASRPEGSKGRDLRRRAGRVNFTFAGDGRVADVPDWIGSHVRFLVPDNLKSGVKKASFYHPEINRSYGRMTEHYTVGVLPARPRKPRDKAPTQNLQHRLANSVRAWRRDIGKAGETYRRSARG